MEEVWRFLLSVNFVAWLGALTGTISLGWKIYTHQQERTGKIKIEIEESAEGTFLLTFTNVGYETRSIMYLGYRLGKKSIHLPRFQSLCEKSNYIEVEPTHFNGNVIFRLESQVKSKKKFDIIRGEQVELRVFIPAVVADNTPRSIKFMSIDSFGKKYFTDWIKA